MQPTRWQEIERLFHSARERTPEERRSFLESITDDVELRREVESLLRHDDPTGHLLQIARRELEQNLGSSAPALAWRRALKWDLTRC